MTIPAILELDKALETFKHTVQYWLQWDDLRDWDAVQLKQREQVIRLAALELALAVHSSVVAPVEH